jgi:hypothetical protein
MFIICKLCIFSVVQSPDCQHQLDVYNELRKCLDELEDKIFLKWTAQVPEQCVKNLEKPLMIQETDTLKLSLNFDDEVMSCL